MLIVPFSLSRLDCHYLCDPLFSCSHPTSMKYDVCWQKQTFSKPVFVCLQTRLWLLLLLHSGYGENQQSDACLLEMIMWVIFLFQELKLIWASYSYSGVKKHRICYRKEQLSHYEVVNEEQQQELAYNTS